MQGVIGEVRLFAGNFAPRTWALCQGQLLAIASNTALFSIVGTTYGGDGRTTFKLPDFRGRDPLGTGTGPGLNTIALGATGGIEDWNMTTLTMGAHNHIINASTLSATVKLPCENGPGNTDGPTTAYFAQLENDAGDDWADASAATKVMGPAAVIFGGSVTMSTEGQGQSVDNIEPRLRLNYIICMQGIYPSRS